MMKQAENEKQHNVEKVGQFMYCYTIINNAIVLYVVAMVMLY